MNILVDILASDHPTIQQAFLLCLHQQFEEAKSLLDKLVEKQDSDAMYLLALFYLEGAGVDKNTQLATYWFKQAISLGHSQAMVEFACYLKTFEPEQELQALSLFHQSASLNNSNAYYYLGLAYLEGTILPINIESAIKLFECAAKFEDPLAQLKLATLYLEDPIFERNIEKAQLILTQLVTQYQKALHLLEPERVEKMLALHLCKNFRRNHQAFHDAQLKLQDIETEQFNLIR